MELFSEVHGLYYHMIGDILSKAHEGSITKKAIYAIIEQQGFQETLFNLPPKLLEAGATDSYNLLLPHEGAYQSILTHPPTKLLTNLEMMWLKSMLADQRIRLFLEGEDYQSLLDSLEDIPPLFQPETIITVGQAMDGDPYEDSSYRQHFRKIIHAILNKEVLRITYLNSKGMRRQGSFLPHRLEYSVKDDKFRLNSAMINRGELRYYTKTNVARMLKVEIIEDAHYPSGVGDFIRSHKRKEPIEIELTNERQGFERCFLHLSSYERNTEYDEESGICRIKLYYYDVDEPELLIMLLSYGPILKVLGPESFRNKLRDRIMRQRELFAYHNQWDD